LTWHNYIVLTVLDSKFLAFTIFKISLLNISASLAIDCNEAIGAPLLSVAVLNAILRVWKNVAISDSTKFKFSPNTTDCILLPSIPSDEPK